MCLPQELKHDKEDLEDKVAQLLKRISALQPKAAT